MQEFLAKHWRTILQILAWILLFISGYTGLGSLQGVSDRVGALQSQIQALQQQNRALQVTVEALQRENALLQEKILFLTECLTNPLPWPGGTLCPKPQK